MGWFKKKPDMISARARALNQEIAQLEAEIKRLDNQLQQEPTATGVQPRLRSTAVPLGSMPYSENTEPATLPAEPVFEVIDRGRLAARAENGSTPQHFNNELGVRKYDLPALVRRMRNHLRGPAASNPKLVSYLAAGGIQGLRPLRYEKRVARNRFIFLVIFLFLTLLGIVAVFVRQH